MEPEWMKSIPSPTICNTYYFLFVAYAILSVVILIQFIFGVIGVKGMGTGVKFALSVLYAFSLLVGVTLAMFLYLMCDRALLAPNNHN
jgi:hypothetical protein